MNTNQNIIKQKKKDNLKWKQNLRTCSKVSLPSFINIADWIDPWLLSITIPTLLSSNLTTPWKVQTFLHHIDARLKLSSWPCTYSPSIPSIDPTFFTTTLFLTLPSSSPTMDPFHSLSPPSRLMPFAETNKTKRKRSFRLLFLSFFCKHLIL